MEEIPALGDLLQPILGTAKATVTTYTTKNLVELGENYGSLMLDVTATLAHGEDLHLVAKKCPESAYMQKLFNIGVTFKREINFYKEILPSLRDFQIRHKCTPIACFAKYFGSRVSLDENSDDVDDGCCLLLENMKIKGYGGEDRMKGFNFDCTMFLLRNLATFHALPIAMKLKEPQTFRDTIKRFLTEVTLTRDAFPPELGRKMTGAAAEMIRRLPKYSQFASAIEEHILGTYENVYDLATEEDEPFGTLVHGDLWTNNTLIKLDANGKIIGNCFVDFQMLAYGNPAHDLMFFLFTSVEIPLIRRHLDDFIGAYYECFIAVLRELKVDELARFAKDKFLAEIERAMTCLQMYHCLFMLQPIYTMKEKATELSQLDEETMSDSAKLDMDKYMDRLQLCVECFVERGWVKSTES